MSKRIVWDDEFETIDLGEGDAITVKARMSQGDENAITEKAFSATSAMSGDDVVLRLSPAAYNRALLAVMIKSWEGPSFVDKAGAPLPCDDENKERLDTDTAGQVLAFFNERSKKRTDAEKKDSTKKSSPA